MASVQMTGVNFVGGAGGLGGVGGTDYTKGQVNGTAGVSGNQVMQ